MEKEDNYCVYSDFFYKKNGTCDMYHSKIEELVLIHLTVAQVLLPRDTL